MKIMLRGCFVLKVIKSFLNFLELSRSVLEPSYPYNDCLTSELNVVTLSEVEVRQMG